MVMTSLFDPGDPRDPSSFYAIAAPRLVSSLTFPLTLEF
jgi:hypothetical protein